MTNEARNRAFKRAQELANERKETILVLDKDGSAGKIIGKKNYDPNHLWMYGYVVIAEFTPNI